MYNILLYGANVIIFIYFRTSIHTHSLSLSLSLSLSSSLYLYIYLFLYLSIYIYLSVSLSLSLSINAYWWFANEIGVRINGMVKTDVQFDVYWFHSSPRTRALLLRSWERIHLSGINFITNKLKSWRRFQGIKWISVIYEELPDRLSDGSSIDRKCPTIEIKKSWPRVLDWSTWHYQWMKTRQNEEIPKAYKKNAVGRCFLPIVEITSKRIREAKLESN